MVQVNKKSYYINLKVMSIKAPYAFDPVDELNKRTHIHINKT